VTHPPRIASGPDQESVWDYPRPPRIEPVTERLRVEFGGQTIADTTRGYRVLETSHPPGYYIPPEDCAEAFLIEAAHRSFCEFKGEATYWDIVVGSAVSRAAAWSYPKPTSAFAPMKDYRAFYASRVDACFVGDEQVQAQEGDFYGGWITSKVVGPFKGAAGTRFW
jgi:uncharacterized protein (DUF427 family)